MATPMVSSKADAPEFVRRLIDTPELWQVVAAFDDSTDGLPARIADLDRVRSGLTAGEADQSDRILAAWRQAPPVGGVDRAGGVEQIIGWLSRFAQRRWDFRQGRERDFLPTSAELLRSDVAGAVYALADRWGLRTPAPVEGEYDQIVVLGGLIRANVNRPATAAQLLLEGQVSCGSVIGLAGERTFSPIEERLAEGLRCPERSEQGSLRWGLARAFGSEGSVWSPTPIPTISELSDAPGGIRVRCGAAPLEGGMRATTGTAFSWLVSRDAGLVRPGSRLLSVTTAIYWIDGHIRLLTQMPEDCQLVTTGTPANQDDPLLQQVYLGQHYLQEVTAALGALPRLLDWARS